MYNIISVDVEDYFHPSEVRGALSPADWVNTPSRVAEAVRRVLELLARHEISGTFFVLGWVAHHHPRLIREIAAHGHEIGCHSYDHRLVYELDAAEFREDTKRAQAAIADACGIMPRLYRAPSYSITRQSMWALEVLAECGFTHDSSIYPIPHDRYGVPGFRRHGQKLTTPSGPIFEVPIATVRLSRSRVAPVGGGAYLRLLPYRYLAAGIKRINETEAQPACIYFHPWEIDPDQPRLASGWVSRVRTYAGIGGMFAKLDRLFSDFRFTTCTAVYPMGC